MTVTSDESLFLDTLETSISTLTGFKNTKLIMRNISKICERMPDSSATVDAAQARELATIFLKGVEMCGQLVSVALNYESLAVQEKKRTRAEAILVRANEKGIKTAKEREIYADMDEDFLRADTTAITAHTFRVLVENKREDLNKAHYHMRKISETDTISEILPMQTPNYKHVSNETKTIDAGFAGRISF